mgnify:CR=1 FL=1
MTESNWVKIGDRYQAMYQFTDQTIKPFNESLFEDKIDPIRDVEKELITTNKFGIKAITSKKKTR